MKSLKGFDAFNKVYKNGRTKSTAKLTMTLQFGNSDTLQFGVGISKKRCKKAVIRNRIKRLLRASVRDLNENSYLQDGISHATLFWKVAPDHPSKISLDDVKPELILLFEKFKSQKK